MFKVGEIVKCIDSSFLKDEDKSHFDQWLVEGNIYTVRNLCLMPNHDPGIYLNEIRGHVAHCLETDCEMEYCFNPNRFQRIGGE